MGVQSQQNNGRKTYKNPSEIKPPIPIFGQFEEEVAQESSFPDLWGSKTLEEDIIEDPRLQNQIKSKKKKKNKTERNIIPDFKIMDLQHNMMQFSNAPQMLLSQNGQFIDSLSLREELRALKLNGNKSKGRLVKPTNPLDLPSVSCNFKIIH